MTKSIRVACVGGELLYKTCDLKSRCLNFEVILTYSALINHVMYKY
jgi:hypothetical protein